MVWGIIAFVVIVGLVVIKFDANILEPDIWNCNAPALVEELRLTRSTSQTLRSSSLLQPDRRRERSDETSVGIPRRSNRYTA